MVDVGFYELFERLCEERSYPMLERMRDDLNAQYLNQRLHADSDEELEITSRMRTIVITELIRRNRAGKRF